MAPRPLQMRRIRTRPGATAVALAVAVLLAGCTGDGDGGSGGGASPGETRAAASPGGQATAHPAPAEVTAEALPVVATRENSEWRLTLNEVRRAGEESVVVVGTLTFLEDNRAITFTGFEETGFKYRENDKGGEAMTNEFSAVTLTVPGERAVLYRVLRDESGACACTEGVDAVSQGDVVGVYAYLSAPKDATKVTIAVRGFAPFVGVPVTS